MYKHQISSASFIIALGIILGAFGAHGLKAQFDTQSAEWFHTAWQYHMVQGLGLLAMGLWTKNKAKQGFRWVYRAGVWGLVLFSGSLYSMSIAQAIASAYPHFLVFITPLGGILMVLFWIGLGIKSYQSRY